MTDDPWRELLSAIGGFLIGLVIWLVVFYIALIVGGELFSSMAAIGWTAAALLLGVALLLFIKFRESPFAKGALLAVCLGLLLSAACGIANPRIGG